MAILFSAILLLPIAASAQINPNPFFNGEASPVPGVVIAAKPAPAAPRAASASRRVRCPRPVVWIEQNAIYKNGDYLGSNPASHDTSCAGVVVWLDSAHGLFRDAVLIGSDARSFEVEDYSGVVVWLDGAKGLWKDGVYLGAQPLSYSLRRGTGEVIWLDAAGGLFRDAALIAADAVSFQLTDPDGRLVWTDRAGLHHIER